MKQIVFSEFESGVLPIIFLQAGLLLSRITMLSTSLPRSTHQNSWPWRTSLIQDVGSNFNDLLYFLLFEFEIVAVFFQHTSIDT